MTSISPERREALLKALAAVRKCGNPLMEKSILNALEGNDYAPLELPSIHPEVDYLWKGDGVKDDQA